MRTIHHGTMIVVGLAAVAFMMTSHPAQGSVSAGESSQSPAETYDTIATSCTRLVVNSNGNFGNNGAGTVNLDYFGPADCDTGLNSRGDSRIYLRDGSPIIIRQSSPGTYVASWSMYGDNRFVRAPGGRPDSSFSTTAYNAYTTGTLLTADSLVKVEVTWYAPTNADSCNFVVQKMLVFPATISNSVTNLQLGQAFDFDIPTDSGTANNISGTDPTRRLVWMNGFNSTDGVTDCADNSRRFGGAALLKWHMKRPGCYDSLFEASGRLIDTLTDPAGQLDADSVRKAMHVAGYIAEPTTSDQIALLTYKDGPAGFTLPANDTLTIMTAIATVRTAASRIAGLDSVKKAIDKARDFMGRSLHICGGGCCADFGRGNVNCSGIIDLGDLSAMVSYLTGGGYKLCCFEAADVNGDGRVDLIDISCLVAYLTGGFLCLPAPCPQ